MEQDQTAGVMVFLLWKSQFLLILRDNKPNIANPNTWCPVTGGVHRGEDYESAGKRELKEEIDIIPHRLKILGVSMKANAFFIGHLSDDERNQIILSEGQRYDFFTFEQLTSLNIKGAFDIYLKRYPDIFRRIAEENYEPIGSDFGLAQWTDKRIWSQIPEITVHP